jgi:Cu/Ag efflux pump CusA
VGRDVDENAFVHFSSPQTGREMTVQLQGPDYGVMEQLAQEVTAGLETIKGLADVKMRFRPGRPQVIVNVTPDSAARRGLTVDEVVETVHGQVRGLRATLLRSRSTQTEVIVRLRSADREKNSNTRGPPPPHPPRRPGAVGRGGHTPPGPNAQ